MEYLLPLAYIGTYSTVIKNAPCVDVQLLLLLSSFAPLVLCVFSTSFADLNATFLGWLLSVLLQTGAMACFDQCEPRRISQLQNILEVDSDIVQLWYEELKVATLNEPTFAVVTSSCIYLSLFLFAKTEVCPLLLLFFCAPHP